MNAPLDFCEALEQDDRAALRTAIDAQLGRGAGSGPIKARVAELLSWVRAMPCVVTAELNPDLLDRQPPIQEIWLTLSGGTQRTLGIVLDRDRLRFDYR